MNKYADILIEHIMKLNVSEDEKIRDLAKAGRIAELSDDEIEIALQNRKEQEKLNV